ncbi:MAG: hypothetical protein Q8Q16_05065, partial [Betaproteobacteria bacterium]|nr:hypothetical protein [Betaproteobacteria bacterium]
MTFRGQSGGASPSSFTGLDAGSAINVSGTNGSRQLSKGTAGFYSANFSGPGQPSFLTAGSYTISGPGGADVGAFQTSLSAGSAFNWL